MTKQRFISPLLLFAFAVIFAHSVVPHHHHEGRGTGHYNAPIGDDHDDIDHDFLGQAFSFFQHDTGNTIVYEAATPGFDYSKISIDKDIFLLVQCYVGKLYEPPLIHFDKYLFSFTSSSYSVTNSFRGPPVLVA